MRFVIVTGMSGAGKSTALKILEDAGYFCVDNLPIPLLEKFAQFIVEGNSGSIQKVALGVDVRSGGGMEGVEKALEEIRLTGLEYEILFLDAEDEVLVKRYKETRRTHPLAGSVKPNETPYKSVMLSETPEGLDAQAMQIIASAIQACGKFQFKSDLYKPQVYADFQLVDYTLISSALPSAESWR